MGNLLRFEFRKLFRSKVFYICIAVSLIMFAISTVTTKVIGELLKEVSEEAGMAAPETTLTGAVLLKGFFSNGNVSLISGIMVVLLVSEDYTNDLTKNIYSKGYTRDELYIAKYIVNLIAVLILLVVGMSIAFLSGTFILDGVGHMGDNYILSIVCVILVAIAYYSLFFGVSILIKKTGGAVAICIIGPVVLSLILTMIDVFINNEKISLSKYWLDSIVSTLGNMDVEMKTILSAIIVSISVSAVMIASSFFVNRKRDN